jgi:N-glycosidase YbiA
MCPLGDSKLTYETDDGIYFYSGPFDPLNNFSAHTVAIWGHTFYTVEHAFQWKKFETTEPSHASKIMNAGSPGEAKKLGRASKNRRSDWQAVKVGFMLEIVSAKAAQHQDFRELLVATGQKTIVENSPVDNFWGCGEEGKGKNQMGKILMEVRASLK